MLKMAQRKHFEPGCHWHAATRTFHGTALWEVGWYGSKRWEYVLRTMTVSFGCRNLPLILGLLMTYLLAGVGT